MSISHWSRSLVMAAACALAACGRPATETAAPPSAPPATVAAAADATAPTVEKAQAVAAAVAEQREAFAAAPAITQQDRATAYQFEFPGLMTDRVPMSAFKGNVVLVVNTASRCGFTPQYEGLQKLYSEDHGRGFVIVGVPSNDFGGQEPGTAAEINAFCEMNYGVTFPMAGKLHVTGAEAHPFYRWAKARLGEAAVPQWNFHKLLIGRDGRLVAAFPSSVAPLSPQLRDAINAELAKS